MSTSYASKSYDNDIEALFSRIQKSLDLPPPQTCGRIAVAMSGGVDSSTVAAALSHLGYDVIGITLKLYSASTTKRPKTCCAGQDIADAQKVAFEHGFPHYVLDYEKRFHQSVIQPFTQSYLQGKTPVPCILCNQTVKFSDLLAHAQDLGCIALVTGHYIQRAFGPKLLRARDKTRDQSYFLFATTKQELAYLRFPLGNLLKTETRLLAQSLELSLAKKQDSQDICFVAGEHYTRFIQKTTPTPFVAGNIRHIDGRLLGQHRGIAHYTIGQRRGIGFGSTAPLFVIDICAQTHEITVGPKEALLCATFSLERTNWLLDEIEIPLLDLHVRVRSLGPLKKARVVFDSKCAEALVSLEIPEDGLAPGQACVFYQGEHLLGGGWIAKTYKTSHKKQGPFLCTSLADACSAV